MVYKAPTYILTMLTYKIMAQWYIYSQIFHDRTLQYNKQFLEGVKVVVFLKRVYNAYFPSAFLILNIQCPLYDFGHLQSEKHKANQQGAKNICQNINFVC